MVSSSIQAQQDAGASQGILVANQVSMTFNPGTRNEVVAFRDISFSLGVGEILAIVGPSGCGKSTLFNIIAGLLEPTAGSVVVDGTVVSGAKGQVGYMLQKDLLLPWRSVLDNVTLGLEVQGCEPIQARDTALALIRTYGLAGFENSLPKSLSGGMRQRVAFMRTLALDPKVILLDEPFSALDFQTRLILQADVKRIIRNRNKAAILVTHDIGEAISMADRVLVLSHRPATVKSIHRIELGDDGGDPVAMRRSARFNEYFDRIWSDLDIQVQAMA
jgi:NitT/TauT family transport system ATP-binding protein